MTLQVGHYLPVCTNTGAMSKADAQNDVSFGWKVPIDAIAGVLFITVAQKRNPICFLKISRLNSL